MLRIFFVKVRAFKTFHLSSISKQTIYNIAYKQYLTRHLQVPACNDGQQIAMGHCESQIGVHDFSWY